MKQYIVTGMTCASCQAHVEKAVGKLENVRSVSVSLLTNSMAVDGDASDAEVIKAVEDAGYGASVKGAQKSTISAIEKLEMEEDALKDRETPKLVKRLTHSIIWLILLMYITMGHNMWSWPVPSFLSHNHLGLALTQMLMAMIVMYINRAFFISGFKSLFHGSPNMDSLVALGSSVSFGWSLYVFYQLTVMITNGATNMELMELYHNGLYFETAAMIPALITVGKTLESLSKGRTTDALKNLMKMAPKTAVLEKDGQQMIVGIDEVKIDDIFIVKPGESIPVDGIIIEGSTAIDESCLTGESIPVDKEAGDTISAATINQSGFIKAKATRIGDDTTFSQIIQMVSDAASTKAPIARIADKVSGIFVPAVIIIAIVVLIGWMIAGKGIVFALERAISVLVISCPCALGLATPVAIMVGNGMGAKNGILFKTSEALENAGHVQIVALDKTGTITEGKPKVTDMIPIRGHSEKELISLAYSLELKSEHPLAKAIVQYGDAENCDAEEVTDFEALSGNGLRGKIRGAQVYGGSFKFISGIVSAESLKNESESLAKQGKTPLFFAKDQECIGMIAVADVIKDDSAKAIKELQATGIEVVMLTGDNEATANAIGRQAGVDHVIAGVLPNEKESVIQQLQKRGKVAMVGDGINDAPALTRADIGIAIGAGTDVAIDSADIVLMNSKLTDVSGAIRLSRATLRNIHENLFWAFAYNTILIPMAAGLYPGIEMNPMWGAAAMSLSSFTVCMNALRLNLFKVHDASKDSPIKKKALPYEEIQLERNTVCPVTMKETIDVEGMMCNMCEKHVQDALKAIDGIIDANADQKTGKVVIQCSKQVSEDDIKNALQEIDYTYAGKETDNMKETVKIEGMMCSHCEATVKKALEALDGVESAEVSHEAGAAVLTLTSEVSDDTIKQTIEAKDYKVTGIEK